MKKPLLILLLLLSTLVIYAQTGKITGIVKDAENKISLELATVSVLRQDSSMLAYTLTDKNGRFTTDKLPINQPLFFTVSYAGYTPHFTTITLSANKTDSLTILLKVAERDTNAVVVTSVIPVRMNGDTLEINPNAFKLKEEAVVEELLTQVSGLTIWSDGTITMNGKLVEQVFVDGKSFLGSTDPRIATQNLPKTAIEKIQLYKEFDKSQIGKQALEKDSLLTMNIKLKEESKRGYFGKISGGLGSRNRYESDLTLQMYNKRNSFGIGAGVNNTNKIIGNVQELFQKNTFRSYNPVLYTMAPFAFNGVNKTHSIGGVYTHNFIETQSSSQNNVLELNYNKSGLNTYLNDFILQNRTTVANPQVIQQNNESYTDNDKHEWGVTYSKRDGYNDNLDISGKGSREMTTTSSSNYTEVRDTANQLQNTNRLISSQKLQLNSESIFTNYGKSDPNNPLKNFNIFLNGLHSSLNSLQNKQNSFQSASDASKDTFNNRNYERNNDSYDINTALQYGGLKRLLFGRLRLGEITLNFDQRIRYNGVTETAFVSDYDSTSKSFSTNPTLTNTNKKQLLEYTPSLRAGKSFSKSLQGGYRNFFLNAELMKDFIKEKNESSIAIRNIRRSFQFLRYSGSIGYYNNKYDKYDISGNLSYYKGFRVPSVDQLYTLVDDINVYNIQTGNPFLKNETTHHLNSFFRYTTNNSKSKYGFMLYVSGNYNATINRITDSVINDLSGKRFSYLVNSGKGKTFSLNGNVNISRKIKKSSIQLSYNSYISRQQLPNYIDSRYNISNNITFSSRSSLQFSLRTLLILNLEHSLQYSKSKQTAAGLTPFKNTTNSIKGGMTLNLPYNIMLNSTMENINNSNLNKPVVLWNSFASYRFMKQQAEFKFSAVDILKQYKNISNSSDPYGTTVRVTNGLQQYFLVTLSYYPRKFGKATIAKRQ